MKKFTCLFAFLFICALKTTFAQQILMINDDPAFAPNPDTILADLNASTYSSGIHYWNVTDSSSTLTDSIINSYDLVIWYCGTASSGLQFWAGGGPTGNPVLVSRAASGKPLWVIGLDILYQEYGDSATFAPGNFAMDYMGLAHYNGQSYTNDGGIGDPEVLRDSGASTLFPATITWASADSPLWYVAGCNAVAGTKNIYEMGPSSYTLYGWNSMFHSHYAGHNVMSTFFEPALINTYANRLTFLQNGITYLLGSESVAKYNNSDVCLMYPNPAKSTLNIDLTTQQQGIGSLVIYDVSGRQDYKQSLNMANGSNHFTAAIGSLQPGTYFTRIADASGTTLFAGKLQKN